MHAYYLTYIRMPVYAPFMNGNIQAAQNWKITGFISLFVAAACGLSILINDFDEESIRSLIRLTAFTSLCLFLTAFTSSSLHTIFHKKWTSWLLKNRRYIGVSFAVSHMIHLGFIFAVILLYPNPVVKKTFTVKSILLNVAYFIIFAMAITSFYDVRKKLGTRYWNFLHTFGSYYLCLIFLAAYFLKALENVFYFPVIALLVLALVFRIIRKVG